MALEPLGSRITPAVSAFFSGGILTVIGDAANNTIEVSRNAAGGLLVNGGAVTIKMGTPTVANTSLISISGGAANDTISLNEVNGALPKANLFGGAGNDTLSGNAGRDHLYGHDGDDVLFGGDGIDTLDGGSGNDRAQRDKTSSIADQVLSVEHVLA